jgi:hypothetical protein
VFFYQGIIEHPLLDERVMMAITHEGTKYSVNIKFGTKFIVALFDVFWKIARTGRFYFEKCHSVAYNLFK